MSYKFLEHCCNGLNVFTPTSSYLHFTIFNSALNDRCHQRSVSQTDQNAVTDVLAREVGESFGIRLEHLNIHGCI